MTEPETVARLVDLLERREPFVHVRFGDGDCFFSTGTGPKLTADGEEWSPALQERLRGAWRSLATTEATLLLGDVESYDVSDGCEVQWRELLAELRDLRECPDCLGSGTWTGWSGDDEHTQDGGCTACEGTGIARVTLVHMEALRCSREHAPTFYRAVVADPRLKVYVGPENLRSAARMLGADLLDVPLRVAHEHADEAVGTILAGGWEVALFSAGRGGKIMQAELAMRDPEIAQVDVGSGLDVLFTNLRRGTDVGVDVEELRRSYRSAGLEL